MSRLTVCWFACVLLFSVSCSNQSSSSARKNVIQAIAPQAESKPPAERKPAPDFALKDSEGNSTKLSDLRGKVVLLNFWATWCGPCALEIPWFVEFEQKLRSQGLEIVGVSMDEEGWKVIKPYVSEHKMNYRVLLGNDSVGQLYGGVDSLPTTFIIDREGRLAFPPHVGLPSKNDYLSEIQTLLDENHQTHSLASVPGSVVLRPTTAHY